MTRKGSRCAIAERAGAEGWHVVEQVRVGHQPVGLVISKSVVVLVRLASVPVARSKVIQRLLAGETTWRTC